jgi:hypothetical protein
VEKRMKVSQNIKIELACDQTIPLLGINPTELKAESKQMFALLGSLQH